MVVVEEESILHEAMCTQEVSECSTKMNYTSLELPRIRVIYQGTDRDLPAAAADTRAKAGRRYELIAIAIALMIPKSIDEGQR